MAITTDLVEAFLKCPTKCFLRARGELETGNVYADWVRTKSYAFRSERIKRLVASVAPDKCATGTAATENDRSAEWQFAIDFAAQIENLRCSCDAVERIPSAGRGRAVHFVPIRFVFSNKLTRLDRLVLAFDACVISKVLGREVTFGRIVHGDDHVTLKVKVTALKNEVEKLTDKIGAWVSSPSPPDLILNRHCPECEFQTRCLQKVVDKGPEPIWGSTSNVHSLGRSRISATLSPSRRPVTFFLGPSPQIPGSRASGYRLERQDCGSDGILANHRQ